MCNTKRELTRHHTLTSLHLTLLHLTSLPSCISPASNDLCTCIIALVVTPRSHAIASFRAPLPRQTTSPPHKFSPYQQHNQPTSFLLQPCPNQTDHINRELPTLSSLDHAPLSRTADGYQPLQLPPHCTHHHRPGCARLLLLRPALHPPIRYEGGTRGKERAPSFTREISHRNLTLHHSLERLFAPSFCPYGCSNLLLNPGSHQRRIPLLLHLHRSQQGRPTLRSQTASQGQQAAQDLTEHNSGRSDLVTSPDLTDPLDDIASPSNQQPHSWQLIASTISV